MITMTLLFFVVELVVGYVTNSMALVADSFHMLSDVLSLMIGFIALYLSESKKPNKRLCFGYGRAEIISALINATFLISLCCSITMKAVQRLIKPKKLEDVKLILIVGAIGLIINIVGLFLFHNGPIKPNKKKKSGQESSNTDKQLTDQLVPSIEHVENSHDSCGHVHSNEMNMKGVYLHVLSDALGSIIVLVSGIIILTVDQHWTCYIDPVMSLLMVGILLKTSLSLLKDSSDVLLQASPSSLTPSSLKPLIFEKIPEIVSISRFNVWQLTSSQFIADIHIKVNDSSCLNKILFDLNLFLKDKGIRKITIEPSITNDSKTE